LTSRPAARRALPKPLAGTSYLTDFALFPCAPARSSHTLPRKKCGYSAYRLEKTGRRATIGAKASHHCLKQRMRSTHQVAHGRGRASPGCGMCGASAPGGRKMVVGRITSSRPNIHRISCICLICGNPAPKVSMQWALEGGPPRAYFVWSQVDFNCQNFWNSDHIKVRSDFRTYTFIALTSLDQPHRIARRLLRFLVCRLRNLFEFGDSSQTKSTGASGHSRELASAGIAFH